MFLEGKLENIVAFISSHKQVIDLENIERLQPDT
jgi:hypothetical protein